MKLNNRPPRHQFYKMAVDLTEIATGRNLVDARLLLDEVIYRHRQSMQEALTRLCPDAPEAPPTQDHSPEHT